MLPLHHGSPVARGSVSVRLFVAVTTIQFLLLLFFALQRAPASPSSIAASRSNGIIDSLTRRATDPTTQAYVTFLASDKFYIGVHVLLKSLRLVNTTRRTAVMVTSGARDCLFPPSSNFLIGEYNKQLRFRSLL